MNRRVVLGMMLVGVAIAVVVWLRSRRETEDPANRGTSAAGSAATAGSAAADSTSPPAGPVRRVRRLGTEERRQLGTQIAAARDRARAERGRASAGTAGSGTGVPPALDDTIALEQVGPSVQAALKEAIPILAECYGDTAADATVAVQMTMTSDPDLGSVIDTDAMKDRDGKPLTPELDDCLRTAIESLALPPLDVGGRLPLEYSFVFD